MKTSETEAKNIFLTETSLKSHFEPLTLGVQEGEKMKAKKAVIVVRLVEESLERENSEIEKEIIQELMDDLPVIPWFESIEKITVTED